MLSGDEIGGKGATGGDMMMMMEPPGGLNQIIWVRKGKRGEKKDRRRV